MISYVIQPSIIGSCNSSLRFHVVLYVFVEIVKRLSFINVIASSSLFYRLLSSFVQYKHTIKYRVTVSIPYGLVLYFQLNPMVNFVYTQNVVKYLMKCKRMELEVLAVIIFLNYSYCIPFYNTESYSEWKINAMSFQ